jgi:hypothetical protein
MSCRKCRPIPLNKNSAPFQPTCFLSRKYKRAFLDHFALFKHCVPHFYAIRETMGSDEEDEPFQSEDPETLTKKTERKRQREKQRRSDLANAFDELGVLVARLEPDDEQDGSSAARKKRRKSENEVDQSGEASGMTRLDLIGRTIETIRRLHKENVDLKGDAAKSRKGGSDDKVRLCFQYSE